MATIRFNEKQFGFTILSGVAALTMSCSPGFQISKDPVSEGGMSVLPSTVPPVTPVGSYSASVSGPFKCDPANSKAVTPIQKLNKLQIQNTYTRLLGSQIVNLISSELDQLTDDMPTSSQGANASAFSPEDLKAVSRTAFTVADHVSNNVDVRKQLVGACGDTLKDPCIPNFVSVFGKRALRRPSTAEENTKIMQAVQSASTPVLGLRRAIAIILQVPETLYQVEVGDAPLADAALFQLTQYEVASRLAFEITDFPPDDALMAAADKKELSTAQALTAQVDRLMASDLGKAKLRRFFSQWLGIASEISLSASLAKSSSIDAAGLGQEMSREFDEFVDFVIYKQKGNYKDLLTSKRSFARTQALASIYKHQLTGDPAAREQLFGDERQGLLLRAAVLASSDGATHPLIRGALIRQKVLCESIGAPPAILDPPGGGVDPDDPMYVATHTTRERAALKTSAKNCMACHGMINAAGFSLEDYDGLGQWRTQEVRYDASGKVTATFPVNAKVNEPEIDPQGANRLDGGSELASAIAQSVKGPSCFVKQTHRYFKSRRESQADSCELGQSFTRAATNGGSLYDSLRSQFLNPSTFTRKIR